MDILLLLATVLWGIWGVAHKRAVGLAHPYTVQWLYALPSIALLPVWYWLGRTADSTPTLRSGVVFWALLAGVASVAATLLFTFALRHKPASIAVAATSAYPVVTLLIGVLTKSEKLTWQLAGGILLIVAGITLTQLTSSS